MKPSTLMPTNTDAVIDTPHCLLYLRMEATSATPSAHGRDRDVGRSVHACGGLLSQSLAQANSLEAPQSQTNRHLTWSASTHSWMRRRSCDLQALLASLPLPPYTVDRRSELQALYISTWRRTSI